MIRLESGAGGTVRMIEGWLTSVSGHYLPPSSLLSGFFFN
jgi:hypothetical protein